MNAQPHTHTLRIHDYGTFWGVSYGDQTKTVDKPRFRDPRKVLANTVRNVIAKHDRASVKAGEDADKYGDAIEAAAALAPSDPTRWGSEQLR